MRNRLYNMAKNTRVRRRVMLASMIMMASPAWVPSAISPVAGQQPHGTPVRVLPPLPLNSSAAGRVIQSNPFCDPAAEAGTNATVQLASGKRNPALRLKPIGAAIGLHPIDALESESTRSPAIVIELPQPAPIKTNHWVASRHHQNMQLVDAAVASADEPPAANPAFYTLEELPERLDHSIVLVSPAPVIKLPAPEIPSAELPASELPASELPASERPLAGTPASMIPAEQVDDGDAIVFSLSDGDNGSPAPSTLIKPKRVHHHVVLAEPVLIGSSSPEETPAAPDSIPSTRQEPPSVAKSAPRPKLSSVPTASPAPAFLAPPTESSQPADSRQQGIATSRREEHPSPPVVVLDAGREARHLAASDEPVIPAPVTAPESTMHDRRYRPPVAVTPLPVAIERIANASASIIRPTVKPVVAPRLDDVAKQEPSPGTPNSIVSATPTLAAKPVAASQSVKSGAPTAAGKTEPGSRSLAANNSQPANTAAHNSGVMDESALLDALALLDDQNGSDTTALYVSRAQVRSLTVGGRVRRVKIGDKNVCQAFATGPNQLKLIGTGNGITQLVVWADTSEDAPISIRKFEIHVQDSVEVAGDTVGKRVELLNGSIRKMFPNCNVSVQHLSGQLIVSGRCDSEASAKTIIRMVRKSCLVSVRDQLRVL